MQSCVITRGLLLHHFSLWLYDFNIALHFMHKKSLTRCKALDILKKRFSQWVDKR